MTRAICPFARSSRSSQVSAELPWTVPADVATDNNVCASPLRPFFGVVAGKYQGTIGPYLLTMSQAMNNTFGCPLFSHATGPWQVSAELLWTVPDDVATDNNVCTSPLRPFFGVVAGKC